MSLIIYGRNPVLEALNSGTGIKKLLVQKNSKGAIKRILDIAENRGIRIDLVEKKDLDLVMDENHQGVIAYIREFIYSSVEDIIERAHRREEPPFIIILDGITDPQNTGAIVRTAEAAGAHGIIIPENRSATVNETVIKTSSGAVFYIPVAKVTNISNTIEILKNKGLWIYGLDMDGNDYASEDMTDGTVVVIGSEGKGLGRLVKKKCDVLVSIPMYGEVDSLNASNAAAIVIYEVRKQRNEV